jgi:eukaryotic-like serine/threonine-protein kinase
MQHRPGTRLGPYEIVAPLGAGGMGEVYRARHLKLRREVALKVLPPSLANDRARLARFEREARTASALNHPGIVTIYDIGEHVDGTTYIAMELVDGRTLGDVIAEGPLAVDDALRIAVQLADALARAHSAGIVHRDVKPANVMVTTDGVAKILDFGIAKPLPGAAEDAAAFSATSHGVLVGTPHYMAPEQVAGEDIDHRADQFAFGVLLYEMLSGRPPFTGASLNAVVRAILVAQPRALTEFRPDAPADLTATVARCLEKEPDRRFASTDALRAALQGCQEHRLRARYGLLATLRRPVVVGAAAAAVTLLGAAGGVWLSGAERRWAERDALAEIARLTENGDLYGAYRLAMIAERHRPGDAELQSLITRITLPASVNSDPPGAVVLVKGYTTPDEPWRRVGTTPLDVRIPYAMVRWRIDLPGHEPFEGAPFGLVGLEALANGIPLDESGGRPDGMVRVPRGRIRPLPGGGAQLPAIELASYFLDRFEVTNRQYREFVDAGGYRQREWWPPTERDGRVVAWQDAMDSFRDATGRAGPSTWELGTYPPGEDEYPVGGISWFEAAAYCAFVGRSLPTVFHWLGGIGQDQFSDILRLSNMDGQGKARVGQFQGVAAWGNYDMAGNVKEWAWNAAPDRRQRYVLGGSWEDPAYLFRHLIALDAWSRDPTHGVRCAAYPRSLDDALLAPIDPLLEYPRPDPIDDAAFEMLRGMYAYDATPLDARVESVNDDLPHYRREVVSIRTAYGDERMDVILLIPRDVEPPYQSVIWYPGDDVFLLRSSEALSSQYLVDFLPRAGRVLVHPVYKGMFERFETWERSPSGLRDMVVRWAQDISRTIDYLETRDDFDALRVAYYALSGGANWGPVFTAVEPRFAASILLAGGLVPLQLRPEMHPVHFAPRAATPTLMINGIDDFILPYEASQLGLFELLGAPPDRKRHARLEGGHLPTNRLELVREVLDWLDQQLGPVQRSRSSSQPTATASSALAARPMSLKARRRRASAIPRVRWMRPSVMS